MTNTEKKEILLEYRNAVRAVREAEDEYRQLQLSVMLPRSPTYDGMVSGGGGHSDQSSFMAMLQQIEDSEILPKQRRLIELRQKVAKAIEALPTHQERLIMRMRYMRFAQTELERKHNLPGTRLLTWDEIAARCNYSRQGATKIHGIALAHLVIAKE